MKSIIFLLLTFYLTSLTFSQGIMTGSFHSKKYPENEYITFKDDGSFSIINRFPEIYQYTDTLSFGSYKILDRKIIELNSFYQEIPNEQFTFIPMKVTEKWGRNSDSLYFIIKSDFEVSVNQSNRFSKSPKPIFYNINLQSYQDVNHKFDKYKFELFSNEFQLPKEQTINSFRIKIIPNNLFWNGYLVFTSLASIDYNVQSESSNIFIIDFPTLDINYLCTKRLYSEYLLIKSKRKIIWQGQEYIKK
jgi:hypothetical protein